MRRVLVALLISISITALAQDQKCGLTPEDFYKEKEVSDVAISPVGDMIAFTLTTILESENKRHREIWMIRLDDGQPLGEPFRFTSPSENSSSPNWSPDGALLSFQSRRGQDKNSTWFMRVSAPGGEAFHLDGVTARPVWSPDGKWIAFVDRPEANDTSQSPEKRREGWIAPDAITKTLDAKRFDGRVITSMRYKRDGILTLLPHYSVRKKAQIFVVPATGGEPHQLTDLPFDIREILWSGSGEHILFTGDELQDDEYNDDYTADIFAVSLEGGEPRKLTTNPGTERSPALSPDGSRLAYIFIGKRGAQLDLFVAALEPDCAFKGEPINLTENWDLFPGPPDWTSDGSAIRFRALASGNWHLLEIPAIGGEIKQITEGERALFSVSASEAGAWMAYTATDAVTPLNLYLSRGDGSGEHKLTAFNDNWLNEIDLEKPERLNWKVSDGTEIEGWLIKPIGYESGKKYPMILKIHGGPHSAYGNYFFRTFHILSASGFFVLYTNPRGSSGYGHYFTYATRGKWGLMDQEDFLTGIDAAIVKYPDIDPERIGVSGGSYGGYMTNWLTANTDRFAAAVTSRSIVDWEGWYGMSDAQNLTEYEFYGTPWEHRELYRKLSPLSYVENVTAPTLIIHSENDYRTPIGDGEQWFMALKKRKVPVELVRYPRSSHGLSRIGEPWLLVDRLERLRSWFVHWLIEKHSAKTDQ